VLAAVDFGVFMMSTSLIYLFSQASRLRRRQRRRPRQVRDAQQRDQLYPMAEKAREAMGTEALTAVADRGYHKSEQILACHEAGIVPMVPKSMTSTAEAHGRFGKEAFRYVPRLDEYRYPANQRLRKHMTTIERGPPCTDTGAHYVALAPSKRAVRQGFSGA
jgi:hypothetical protein